jgi:hypothetical protein
MRFFEFLAFFGQKPFRTLQEQDGGISYAEAYEGLKELYAIFGQISQKRPKILH